MANDAQAVQISDDEYTVLMIMAEGESLAAIGRWEKPLDALVERGLARRADKFNNFITPEGRAACEARETTDVVAILQNVPRITKAQTDAQYHVGIAAENLAAAARASAPVTGDPPEVALMAWNLEVLKRARELLRE